MGTSPEENETRRRAGHTAGVVQCWPTQQCAGAVRCTAPAVVQQSPLPTTQSKSHGTNFTVDGTAAGQTEFYATFTLSTPDLCRNAVRRRGVKARQRHPTQPNHPHARRLYTPRHGTPRSDGAARSHRASPAMSLRVQRALLRQEPNRCRGLPRPPRTRAARAAQPSRAELSSQSPAPPTRRAPPSSLSPPHRQTPRSAVPSSRRQEASAAASGKRARPNGTRTDAAAGPHWGRGRGERGHLTTQP